MAVRIKASMSKHCFAVHSETSSVLTTPNWITRLMHSVELIWILSNFSTFPTFQCAAVTHQIEPQHSSRASNKFEFLLICCAALLLGSKTNGDQLIFQRTGMTKDILLFNLVMVRLGYFDSSHSPQNIGHGFDDVLAWPALSMIWPVAIGRFVWWPSQIHLKSSDHQSHLRSISSENAKQGFTAKQSEAHTGAAAAAEKVKAGVCRLTDVCRQELVLDRQQLVLGRQECRQADSSLYKADKQTDTEHPQWIWFLRSAQYNAMNHWFLPLRNLSSNPYNICNSSNQFADSVIIIPRLWELLWILEITSGWWGLRRTILMIRVLKCWTSDNKDERKVKLVNWSPTPCIQLNHYVMIKV